MAGPRGFVRAKKVDGVKRILVDSTATLVAALVNAADVQDREALPNLLRRAKRVAPTIAHVWLANGYTGTTVTWQPPKLGASIDIVFGPKPASGFQGSATSLGRRTHQRLDRPHPPTRPPLRNHPRSR
ncbi:hypothetical protein [Mycobacterium sp.]|uniref:hypothetical protein n=1 Tax=Mycobacterium sp. TaxID=1785 RepID=UPI003C77FC67